MQEILRSNTRLAVGKMGKSVLSQQWVAGTHLQDLIRFRNSGVVLEAGEDWLDKEIEDLQNELELINQSA